MGAFSAQATAAPSSMMMLMEGDILNEGDVVTVSVRRREEEIVDWKRKKGERAVESKSYVSPCRSAHW